MTTNSTSNIWDAAKAFRLATNNWVLTAKVSLDQDPTRSIGSLNAKKATVRDLAFKIRDVLFEVKTYHVALRREMHAASDAYEDALAGEMAKTRTEDEVKKLPKSAEEREKFYRLGFPHIYQAKLETSRRVEEWESHEKSVNLIYYSLKDTEQALDSQLSVIKQQYFSGELKLNKDAASFADFLGDDAKHFFPEGFELPPSVTPSDGMETRF